MPRDVNVGRCVATGVMRLLTVSLLLGVVAERGRAAPLVESITVTGDSISRAFNADTGSCNYGDNVSRVWSTGDDHGSNFCSAGSDGTFSQAERLECAKGGHITIFNDAESGADMLNDFRSQATTAKLNLVSSSAPRLIQVFMGHNDACTNTVSKTGNGCGGDRDPNNYCRTTPAAFEREFRAGMDQLIQISNARINVLATARASELCNFEGMSGCGLTFGLPCGSVWSLPFVDICRSLTDDCSDQRRIDMYETLLVYNQILMDVSDEYALIPTGGISGGGAVKASDVHIRFSVGPFYYKFISGDVSCCDCFHPSDQGQAIITDSAWNGLTCSPSTPCCADTGDSLTDARCDVEDHTGFYEGGFWPGGQACGNGLVDPGEQCDDGNLVDGDCCSSACTAEPAGQACGDDGNLCTDDVCDGAGACSHDPNTDPCDDGAFCTVGDTCAGGSCQGTPRDCSGAADQCNDGLCDEGLAQCVPDPVPDGAACDDGNACTNDQCVAGVCSGFDGCGDGVVNASCGEECDDGAANGTNACCSVACALIDSDTDGICDRDDECTGGVAATRARLKIKGMKNLVGKHKLTFSGEVQLPHPFFPALDPKANGVRVVVRNLLGGLLLDETLPGGNWNGFTGWVGTGPRWAFRDKTATPPGGITRLIVKDKSKKSPGLVFVKVKAGKGYFPVEAGEEPVSATIVLDPPTTSAQCGEATFPGPPAPACFLNAAATTLVCK